MNEYENEIDDDIDPNNYKGIYFNDNTQKFTDEATGAHFEYFDMFNRLTKIAKALSKSCEPLGRQQDCNIHDEEEIAKQQISTNNYHKSYEADKKEKPKENKMITTKKTKTVSKEIIPSLKSRNTKNIYCTESKMAESKTNHSISNSVSTKSNFKNQNINVKQRGEGAQHFKTIENYMNLFSNQKSKSNFKMNQKKSSCGMKISTSQSKGIQTHNRNISKQNIKYQKFQ